MIQKVVPQASGESSKIKVKVRVNIHGIFSVSSASLVEVLKSDETEEPMETEQAQDKDAEVFTVQYPTNRAMKPPLKLCMNWFYWQRL